MLEYFPRVNILHCGGEEEIEFIKYLENAIASTEAAPFVLEYTEFHEQQDKEAIIYYDAEKYKNDQMPIIMLLSKQYFELMWASTHKQAILNIITAKTTKHCLHVWLNVSEDEVKIRSKSLLSEDQNFRRIKVSELRELQSSEMINRIRTLLDENRDNKSNNLNNYSVDDEEEEMRIKFADSYYAANGVLPPNPNEVAKKQRKKKPGVYKDALRMASMNPEELEEYIANKHSTPSTSKR